MSVLSQLRDQAAHSTVCGAAGVLAGVALPLLLGHFFGPVGAELGKVASCLVGGSVQLYRESGQHGLKAVLTGEKGLADMAFGTLAGVAGALFGVQLPA